MGQKLDRIIKVQQKHIDQGIPESSARCMIAEALKDSIPGSKKVHVDMQTIRYTDDKGVRRTYLTNGSAQAALVRFDAGDEVLPFSVRLHQPIHISRGRPQASKRKTEVARDHQPRARLGGRPVPVMGNSTRRKFGIRGLRINQEGQVVQSNLEP
jgi:hypothetical protein